MWLPSEYAIWTSGVLVVALSAVVGGVLHWSADRFARARPTHFLGSRASLLLIVLHACMLGIVAWRLEADGRDALGVMGGFWAPHRGSVSATVALPVLIGVMTLATLWSRIPVLKRFASAGDPSSYAPGGRLTIGALALLILVRYPLTVVAEETIFRGYLQRYLGWGIVLSSFAFAAYHVMQWRTIPSLLPYAFALGVLAAWTGSLFVGGVLHYVMDAGFALVIVLPHERRRTGISASLPSA